MIEVITPHASAKSARAVLFDFDGTLSLIRAGWVDVMVPMMVEALADLKTGESEADLRDVVEDYVGRLTGKETIYQMIEFSEHLKKRGASPKDPAEYKRIYLERLWLKIKDRIERLQSGVATPDEYLVPGSRELLESLKERGLRMYLASGTDHNDVEREAALLQIDRYFDGGIYGAQDDYKSFSKAILIKRIIENTDCAGNELLGFGDGYVEIENVKEVGGVAVGVATAEPECRHVDEWKRNRLVRVGADYIVPNYTECGELLDRLFE